uniref:Uncharacterized protein n=1 Tax=Triticum urartu TaxID=4572 RepID=A0A8R7K2E1_TRIUA
MPLLMTDFPSDAKLENRCSSAWIF